MDKDLGRLLICLTIQAATFFILLRLNDLLARLWTCICGAWIGAIAMPSVIAVLQGSEDLGYIVPLGLVAGAVGGCAISAWLTNFLETPSPPRPPIGDPFHGRGLLCFAGSIAGVILYVKVNILLALKLIPHEGWDGLGYSIWSGPLMAIGGAFVGFAYVRHRTSGARQSNEITR
jgi:hypothetical protein